MYVHKPMVAPHLRCLMAVSCLQHRRDIGMMTSHIKAMGSSEQSLRLRDVHDIMASGQKRSTDKSG